MRFRRRRGLGGGGSRGGGDGGEGPGGEEGGSGSGGPGGRGALRGTREAVAALLSGSRIGRWAAGLAVLGLLFGGGYLLSARVLFPASSPEAAAGEVVEVPDLVGLAAEDARAALDGAGLDYLVRSEMPHRDAPEGAVIAQSPLPGQLARPGAPVEVTLSEGPRRRAVPDLRGLSDRQASIVLGRLGFRTSVDTAASEVERGRVVGTRPPAGQELTLPAEVVVVVSRGPEVADVPELVGLHVDDVRARLRDRGFRMGEVTYDPEAYAAPGRVIGQTPAPGYALRVGGRVSVRVAGSPPEPPADSLAPPSRGDSPPPAGPDSIAPGGPDSFPPDGADRRPGAPGS